MGSHSLKGPEFVKFFVLFAYILGTPVFAYCDTKYGMAAIYNDTYVSGQLNDLRQDEKYDMRESFGTPGCDIESNNGCDISKVGKKDPLYTYSISNLIYTNFWFLPTKDPARVDVDKTYNSLIYGKTLKTKKANCIFPHKNQTFETTKDRLDGIECQIIKTYELYLEHGGPNCDYYKYHVRERNPRETYLVVPDKFGSKIATYVTPANDWGRTIVLFDKNIVLHYRLYRNIKIKGQELPIPVIGFQILSYKLVKHKRFGSNPF